MAEAAPLVAICMATYEPPATLFRSQVDSIRRQTHSRFVCMISDDGSDDTAWRMIRATIGDDERFVASRSAERRGFYENFERALSQAPAEAEYAAFADQDDVWNDDKLAVLVDAIRSSGAELVFSDMTVVDDNGLVTGNDRPGKNEVEDLGSLLMMNTVTGAAALFRREVVETALPFPPRTGNAYHDHWIACVARARGRIHYVDRPLYRYVQHSANAAGAFTPSRDYRGGLVHALARLAAEPRARVASTVRNAPEYADEVARVEIFARTLLERLGGRLDEQTARLLRRAARLDSLGSLAWLLGRSARDLRGDGATLGAELQLVKGVVWRRWRKPSLGVDHGR